MLYNELFISYSTSAEDFYIKAYHYYAAENTISKAIQRAADLYSEHILLEVRDVDQGMPTFSTTQDFEGILRKGIFT